MDWRDTHFRKVKNSCEFDCIARVSERATKRRCVFRFIRRVWCEIRPLIDVHHYYAFRCLFVVLAVQAFTQLHTHTYIHVLTRRFLRSQTQLLTHAFTASTHGGERIWRPLGKTLSGSKQHGEWTPKAIWAATIDSEMIYIRSAGKHYLR